MRKYVAAILLIAGVSGGALAAPAAGPERTFQTADLFSLEVATDPQISPDGGKIAYVRRSGDIMTDSMRPSIWLIDTRTGQQVPLATGTGSHSQPHWSPDGKRLAYLSTAEGGGAQLFVRWMDSGQSVRITGLPDTPDSIAWSPDGRHIAYSMFVPDEGMQLGKSPPKPEGAKWAEPLEIHSAVTYRADGAGYLTPGYSHIFLVSSEGGPPRQLSFGAVNDNGPLSWSPDGASLYFSGNRSPDWERALIDSEVYRLDIASGAVSAITNRRGPDTNPSVSPDGSKIAYIGFDDLHLGYQNAILYVMDRNGSNVRALTRNFDRSFIATGNPASPIWAADGRSIYAGVEDKGSLKVARVGLDGSVRFITENLGASSLEKSYPGGSFSLARDGSLAITLGHVTRPADVGIVRGGTARQLTHLNATLLDHKIMGEVRPIQATAFDGRTIEAWLTLPPNAGAGQRHPLILEIHGGPFWSYGPHFSTDNQLYAAAGYAVLSVNPRGSTSYGEEFANLIHYAFPGRDYDDLMSAVDAAITQGFADPDRLYVTGGSGGGLLTAWIIGKNNRFKAASTQKPVIDWTSQVLTSDLARLYSPYWFAKKPWEDPTSYWARSPLSLVGNVKTPTLVIVGSEDYRTPVNQAEQYYTALQLVGVPTALAKVPGASHGGLAARPSQSGAKVSAVLAWFEKYKDGLPQGPAATAQ